MKVFKSFGAKIAGAAIAATITAGLASADVGKIVDVTLPEPVVVGNTTLPGGAYRIIEVPVAGTESLFEFQNANGNTAAAMPGERIANSPSIPELQKTGVVLAPSESGGPLHLNKLYIQGETGAYEFTKIR